MKKVFALFLGLATLVSIISCDKTDDVVNDLNSVKDESWKFGTACTFKYKEKTGVLTQKYLNKIVGYYAGLAENEMDTVVIKFASDKTLLANGKLVEGSSWSQDGSAIEFSIGKDLKFSGKVYVSYVLADAKNVNVDLLPETVKILLGLMIDGMEKGVLIDELTVYLDKQ